MDRIVINDIELTKDEFNCYKDRVSIADIIEARNQIKPTDQERQERKLKWNIKTLRGQIDGDGLDVRLCFDDRSRSWFYYLNDIELYIEITDIELDDDDNLDYIELYVNQDNNVYVTKTVNDNESLIEFLNDCVDYIRKLSEAKDACPY